MNTPFILLTVRSRCLPGPRLRGLASLCLLATSAPFAEAQTNLNPATPLAVTNAVAAGDPIPQSVFVVPRKPEEGRDPFFPTSTRLFGGGGDSTNRVVNPTVVLDLKLKGISGVANKRLALINNYTFEAGEEVDLVASGRRVRVRCLQITDTNVIIEVGGERRELRLRSAL